MVGVEGRLTEEVRRDDDLCSSEEGSDPEEDESNDKQVVQDIVATDIDSSGYYGGIL